MEILFYLLLFGTLFAFWAVIGHVFWLAIAAIVKGVFGTACPNCHRLYLAEHNCTQRSTSAELTLSEQMRVVEQLTERVASTGMLAADEKLHVQAAMVAFRRVVQEQVVVRQPLVAQHAAPCKERVQTTGHIAKPIVDRREPSRDVTIAAEILEERETARPRTPTPKQPHVAEVPPTVAAVQNRQYEPKQFEGVVHPLDEPEFDPQSQSRADGEKGPTSAGGSLQQKPADSAASFTLQRKQFTADVLQRFMQQSNIRWVELVSASLVVVCSVGLVISLWSTLSQASRFFPSLVFLSATLAVHAAGQYTLRKWNLRSTSRGILHIALMLIPLGVLVGMRMAVRDEHLLRGVVEPLGLSGYGAIACGMLIYSGLAITACVALFPGRWRTVAAAIILASCGLVAINITAPTQRMTTVVDWGFVALVASVCLATCVSVGRRVANLWRCTEGKARSIAGSGVHMIFATCVLMVFAFSQLGEFPGGRQLWWWVAGGVSFAWATPASAIALNVGLRKATTVPAWLRVGGWLVLMSTAAIALLSVRYMPTSQLGITVVAGLVGVWCVANGVCGNRTTMTSLGSLAVWCSGVLGIALLFGEPELTSSFKPWIKGQNIAVLSIAGFLAVVISAIPAHWLSANGPSANTFFFPRRRIEVVQLLRQFGLMGIVPFGLACVLTFVASFNGATWASWVLLLDGGTLIVVSLACSSQQFHQKLKWSADKLETLSQILAIIGQGLMLIGGVQLAIGESQVHDFVVGALGDSLAKVWWTGGAIAVAMTWPIAGVAGRVISLRSAKKGPGEGTLTILAVGGIWVLIGSILALAAVSKGAGLSLVAFGLVPVALLLNLLSCRAVVWRDLLVVSFVLLCGWCGLHAMRSYEAVEPLGLASASAVVILASLAGLVAIAAALSAWRQRVIRSEVQETIWHSIGKIDASSLTYPAILWVAWVAILLPLGVVFTHIVQRALGIPTDWASAAFLGAALTAAQAMLIALTLSCIEVMSRSSWLGSAGLRIIGGVLPASACVLLACTVPVEQCIFVLLWALATAVVVFELFPQRWTDKSVQSESELDWLTLARSLVIAGLLSFTSVAFFHAQRSGAAGQWSFVLAQLFPAAIALTVGWVVALRRAGSRLRLVLFGVSMIGCVAMAAYHVILEPNPVRLIHVVTISGIAMSLLSASRYFSADQKSLEITWGFSQGALVVTLGRSILAMVCIILASLGRGGEVFEMHGTVLGGVPPLVGLTLVFVSLRGALFSSFRFSGALLEQVMLGLAMSAPLVVVVASASMFNLDFGTDAGRLAPMHMLVVLWAVALAIGLVEQSRAFFGGASTSWQAWTILAIPTCGFAMILVVATRNSWSVAELSALAAMVLVSGKMAGSWLRPYGAALLVSFALLPTFGVGIDTLGPWGNRPWYACCGLLAGPLIVVAVSMVIDQLHRRFQESKRAMPNHILTIQQSGLLLIACVSMFLSVAWLLPSSMQRVGAQWDTVACLLISFAALVLSVARIWDMQEKQRFFVAYSSAISLSALLAVAGLAVVQQVSILQSSVRIPGLLVWVYAILTAMCLVTQVLRELELRGTWWAGTLHLDQRFLYAERLREIVRWMVPLHLTMSVFAILPAVAWVLGDDQRWLRVSAAALPIVGVATVWALLKQAQRSVLYVVLGMICTGWVFSWWTFVPREVASPGYYAWAYGQHTLAASIFCGLSFCVYAAWLSRKSNRGNTLWIEPLYKSGWFYACGGLVLGAMVLFVPEPDYLAGGVSVEFTRLISVFAWLAIVIRLLQFAARPLRLDAWAQDKTRKAAVYGAQLALVVVCVRLNVCYPHLFDGFIRSWWPVVVLLVALGGALVSAWLRRRGEEILAEPLDNVALLLPLLPIVGLGVWHSPGGLWSDWTSYSIVLLAVAAMYAVQSLVSSRGESVSVGLRGLSVGLLLLSYWSFLCSNPSWSITEHPQFWLLPPALATLLYVEWSKSMLSKEALAATRYISLLVAYLSSSAEAFMSAFAAGLWQPVILILLALGGMLAGIVMRIRSFLYCGAAFTFVALLSMVLQAQQRIGQVWPWWAFGIATGVSLIVALGYMEKNRGRVTSYIAKVRGWHS